MSERVVPTKPDTGCCPGCFYRLAGKDGGLCSECSRPVAFRPSAEAVQAAVEAMRKAAFLLEAYGDHAVTLRNAIAGLTGKGGV